VDRAGELVGEAGVEAVAQFGDAVVAAVGQFPDGELGDRAQGDGECDVLGTRAQSVFLPPAVDQGLEGDSVAYVQGGDALRRIHLMADDCQQVNAQAPYVQGDFPAA
jgi:hypothetical protein